MQRKIWNQVKRELNIWKVGAFPELLIVAFIVVARLSGSLQFLELISLDALMRLRPPESVDKKVVIVGINEKDIKELEDYPITDEKIALLLNKIQKYQPKVIGLDVFRDKPVNPGNQKLEKLLKENSNIIGIEKVLPPYTISAQKKLPLEKVGFSDVIPDYDGKVRRILLGTKTSQGYKFSFPLRLVENYLAPDTTLGNGIVDKETMRFKSTEIPRFKSNFGGYVGENDSGLKTLLNFRNGKKVFNKLSFQDVINGEFEPELIRNNIVIIGITAESVPDFIHTSAVAKTHRGMIYGVEFHAHATSQILNAVLHDRPLLETLPDKWEYIWIVSWGMIGIFLSRKYGFSVYKTLFGVIIAGSILIITGYSSLIYGLWLPVAPVLIILFMNAGISSFYKQEQAIKESLERENLLQKTIIEVRENTIKETFREIHNGPLQTLAVLMRDANNNIFYTGDLCSNLEHLNEEIRDIGDNLKLEAPNKQESLRLTQGLKLDLNRPIHELFYEVYSNTIERNFVYFKTLKAKVREFEPIKEEDITIEQKKELCQFLEEALCNVGKHAEGVKRLSAIGESKDGWYTLSIKDNGVGITSCNENQGTKNAVELSQKLLSGKFTRKSIHPKGTLCELTWCLNRDVLEKNKFKPNFKFLFKLN